jgi:hypothetical protein
MRPDLEGDRVLQLLDARVVGHVALGAGDGVAQPPLALGRKHDGASQPVFVALPALQGSERALDLTLLEQSRGQADRYPGTTRRNSLVDGREELLTVRQSPGDDPRDFRFGAGERGQDRLGVEAGPLGRASGPGAHRGDQGGAAVGVQSLPPDLSGTRREPGSTATNRSRSDCSSDAATAAMTASTARRASSVSLPGTAASAG